METLILLDKMDLVAFSLIAFCIEIQFKEELSFLECVRRIWNRIMHGLLVPEKPDAKAILKVITYPAFITPKEYLSQPIISTSKSSFN